MNDQFWVGSKKVVDVMAKFVEEYYLHPDNQDSPTYNEGMVERWLSQNNIKIAGFDNFIYTKNHNGLTLPAGEVAKFTLEKKMNKVLITGGAGFIGSHLTKRLVKNGYDVTVVDNLERGNTQFISDVMDKITFVTANLTQYDEVKNLFEDKVNIICEIEKTAYKKQERALELFRNLKMRIRYMEPKSHDKHIAYVSHLSHISSFMLGKTVIEKEKDEKDIFDMAGSGFESTVRLAKSSPSMWTPIFKQNKKQIVKSLEEYIANLSSFKSFLESDDYEAIFNEMKNTNRIKEILK
jgi:prephenate dehydrogenase